MRVWRKLAIVWIALLTGFAHSEDHALPPQKAFARAFECKPERPWVLSAANNSVRILHATPPTYWDFRPCRSLTIDARFAEKTVGSVRLRWAVSSRIGGVYCAFAPVNVANEATPVTLNFDPAVSELVPSGHSRAWDALAASEIVAIELRAECTFGAKTESYALELANAEVELRDDKPCAPRLLDACLSPAPATYRAQAQLTFRIDPPPRDPFAPDGDGDVRVLLPDGREVLAFLEDDFASESDGSAQRRAAVGRAYWCAYLPDVPAAGGMQVRSGATTWKLPQLALTHTAAEAANPLARERIPLPLEAKVPPAVNLPAFELTKSGEWKALSNNPRDKDRTVWRPVPFWNAAWGAFHGAELPNGALARQFDALLDSAALRGDARPLAILDGEALDRVGVFNWSGHPLSGDLSAPGELFRTEAGLAFSRRVMRYSIARWGLSKAVSALWLTPTLPTPSVPEFHAKLGKELRGWADVTNVPVISLHPFVCEPKVVSNLAYLQLREGQNMSGWAPIAACNATGTRLASDGVNNGKCYEVRSNDPALTHLGMINTFHLVRQEFDKTPIDDFNDADTISFDLWIPANAPPDLRVGVHVRDRDALWYETMLPGMLRPGDWNTCTFDITAANANGLTPLSHKKAWTEYSRQRISEIGIHLFSTHPNWMPMPGIGPLPLVARFANIRALKLQPDAAAPASAAPVIALYQPRFADFDVFAAKAVYVGGLWQQHLHVSKTFANPFDPRDCDLTAVITAPSGKVVRVPCFFDELCERHEKEPGGAELLDPLGEEFFTVRFRATEPGPHQVRFELRDGGKYEPDNSNSIYEKLRFVPGKISASFEMPAPAFSVQPGSAPETKPFHGFLRPAANKRNLEFTDGTFFYPIGPNLRSPADWLFPYNDDKKWTVAFADSVAARQTYQYDDYFKAFEPAGITWARIWLCAYSCALEWRRDWPGYQGLCRYNLLNAWRLDHMLADAERRGIEISLCLTNHGQYSAQVDAEWAYNPYSAKTGGPLNSAADFYTNRETRIGLMNRLRYTVARYGHSPAIMTWSLFSEVEWTAGYKHALHWNNTPDDPVPVIDAWHADMAQYLKALDPNQHMVATHFSHPWRGFGTLSVPEMEIASSNAYSSMFELGIQEMDAAAALAAYWKGHSWFKGFKAYGKPALVEEQGRHWDGAKALQEYGVTQSREQLDADLHAGIWGSMVQPLAGATGYWWWMHLHFDDRYSHYKAFAKFMAGEDFRPLPGEPLLEPVFRAIPGTDEALLGRALKSDRRMYGWVYHNRMPVAGDTPKVEGGKIRVGGLKPGVYALEFWNTYTGEKMESRELDVKSEENKPGSVEFQLPPVERDLAFKLKLRR